MVTLQDVYNILEKNENWESLRLLSNTFWGIDNVHSVKLLESINLNFITAAWVSLQQQPFTVPADIDGAIVEGHIEIYFNSQSALDWFENFYATYYQ